MINSERKNRGTRLKTLVLRGLYLATKRQSWHFWMVSQIKSGCFVRKMYMHAWVDESFIYRNDDVTKESKIKLCLSEHRLAHFVMSIRLRINRPSILKLTIPHPRDLLKSRVIYHKLWSIIMSFCCIARWMDGWGITRYSMDRSYNR